MTFKCRSCGVTVLVNGKAAIHVYEECARCAGRECSYCARPKTDEFPTCHRQECWVEFVTEYNEAIKRFGSLPKYADVASFSSRRSTR